MLRVIVEATRTKQLGQLVDGVHRNLGPDLQFRAVLNATRNFGPNCSNTNVRNANPE
jgi:hypothetical protein